VADPSSDAGTSRLNAGARSGAGRCTGAAAIGPGGRGDSGGTAVTGPTDLVSDDGAIGAGPGVPRGHPRRANTPRAPRPRTMTRDKPASDPTRTFRPRSL